MRNFALLLAVLPTAAIRLGGTPAMQVYTPLIAPERRPLIAGNWKLNPQTRDEAVQLATDIAASITSDSPDAEVALFVPYVFIETAMKACDGKLMVGAEVRVEHIVTISSFVFSAVSYYAYSS